MAAVFDEMRDDHIEFIGEQPVFFVASAPNGPDGHVNLSPKGGDHFRVLGRRTVAYLDLTGSGAETIAHTRQNGRLTIMFCSFGPKPLVLRLFGRSEVLALGTPEFEALAGLFEPNVGSRAIIRLAVTRVQTSCGYGVPVMDLVEVRPRLDEWAERKGPDGIAEYHRAKTFRSIDGLPAMEGL